MTVGRGAPSSGSHSGLDSPLPYLENKNPEMPSGTWPNSSEVGLRKLEKLNSGLSGSKASAGGNAASMFVSSARALSALVRAAAPAAARFLATPRILALTSGGGTAPLTPLITPSILLAVFMSASAARMVSPPIAPTWFGSRPTNGSTATT